MQTFSIVQQISLGRKRVDGRMVDTMQAIVNFGTDEVPELTTRHLEHYPVFDEKGGITGWHWIGWNSNVALRERDGILADLEDRQANLRWAVKLDEARLAQLQASLADRKGKRGAVATAERKLLREAIKTIKASAAVADDALADLVDLAHEVNETHPEIVEFA